MSNQPESLRLADILRNLMTPPHAIESKCEVELRRLHAANVELLEALKTYEEAHEGMFAQCCSNPITDAWGRQLNMRKFNEAHYLADKALKTHGGQHEHST